MNKIFVQYDNEMNVVNISTDFGGVCASEVMLDSPIIDFARLEGYKVELKEDSILHLVFDEEKWANIMQNIKRDNAIAKSTSYLSNVIQTQVLKDASDKDAYAMRYLYSTWSGDSVKYEKDDRLMYKDKFYKVLQTHTSQEDWTPDTAVSQFVEIPDPSVEYPEWKQPISAETAYNIGNKVTYNGKKYISNIDANTWSPDEYPSGWTLVE